MADFRLVAVDTPAALTALPEGVCAPLAPEAWARTRPHRHLAVLNDDGRLAARASVWWNNTPSLPGDPAARVGLVGHFSAAESGAGGRVLTAALAELRSHGCTYALGPMDGSTWHAYRLVTDASGDASGPPEPPFALEPWTPPAYVAHFEASGFRPVAHYLSALAPTLEPEPGRLADAERRLAESGVALRPFNPSDVEGELGRLYAVSSESFSQNLFFTPLGFEDFAALYRPLLPHLRPDLFLLAEREGEPLGFVFALPDGLRGAEADTVIVKTVAVRPQAQGLGLGGALVARAQAEAARLGFTRAIHALMHDANRSTRISQRDARPVRRYALFGRALP